MATMFFVGLFYKSGSSFSDLTQKMARPRHWCWTLNNYSDEDVEAIKDWPGVVYTVFGFEQGDQGTKHLQGYTEFIRQYRLSTVRNKFHAKMHWEGRRGTRDQARDYCMKDGEYVEVGEWVPGEQGKRNDLLEVKDMIDEGKSEREIAEEHFGTWTRSYKAFERYRKLTASTSRSKPEVTVLYGPTGTGKSHTANEMFPDAYRLDNRWWDGYDGQDAVIIDEFNGWIPCNSLLRVMDKFPYRVENKGGSVPLVATKIVITSHFHPSEWYAEQGERLPEILRRIDHLVHMTTRYEE